MRMTRAALRAQTQIDDPFELEQTIQGHEDDSVRRKTRSTTQIFEEEAGTNSGIDDQQAGDLFVRAALRDITDENYPKADGFEKLQSRTPAKTRQQAGEDKEEVEETRELRKSARKSKGQARSRSRKKTDALIVTEAVVELETEEARGELLSQPEVDVEPEIVDLQQDEHAPVAKPTIVGPQTEPESDSLIVNEISSEPGPAIEEGPEPELEALPAGSKTPKFDPEIHTLQDTDEASTVEDSFAEAIRSRSPAKSSLLDLEPSQTSETVNSNLQAHAQAPLRRVSSTKFEQSFEAMDSLEDNIEQLTAGFAILPAEDMQLNESPIKTERLSVRLQHSTTPKTPASRTPRSGNRPPSMLRLQEKDKENTPPTAKTPLMKAKTPLTSKTPATSRQSSLKSSTTPAVKSTSPTKAAPPPSARKSSTPSTAATPTTSRDAMQKTAATSPAKPAVRKSVINTNSNTKENADVRKSTASIQRRLTNKQPLANTTNTKSEILPKKATMTATTLKTHQSSLSFSNSPAKQRPSMHTRRVTSGGILSTSKPGFIPAKSSKPPTISTFALPGEAIAEKLKAAKEAREEKMRQPKITPAEQKAAKLKAEREAREERVKQNQLKAQEKEVEKQKPARPVASSTLTVSKARAQAAERSRQASKDWAEKMLKKKQHQQTQEETPTTLYESANAAIQC
ncbi:hypothetical protein LTR05_003684 [Lithohypha guttulata]|uniref:Uncharacterized protein n=1 Tax=Lithohypha guttulata TaxID=1690604 RepID=A0AAN7T0E1_9EURO|nr:hypothetical protein LTR05_003684 [Lithohypha guttulata]